MNFDFFVLVSLQIASICSLKSIPFPLNREWILVFRSKPNRINFVFLISVLFSKWFSIHSICDAATQEINKYGNEMNWLAKCLRPQYKKSLKQRECDDSFNKCLKHCLHSKYVHVFYQLLFLGAEVELFSVIERDQPDYIVWRVPLF